MSEKTKQVEQAPMGDKEYAQDHGGLKCPFCRSENIEGQPDGELDGQSYWATVKCLDCGKGWRDIYLLSEYSSLNERGQEVFTPGKPGESPARKFKHKPSGMNFNCLAGLICPECGNEKKLIVEVKSVVALLDDGTDHDDSDAVEAAAIQHEFDDTSITKCPKCRFVGVLGDFRYEE